MKAATISQIKKELRQRPEEELIEICLRLSRFKKENKELLTYLLFESDYEPGYIDAVKANIDSGFEAVNPGNFYFIKKSIRKVLRETKKYIRYSGNKETEVNLLLYFCAKMNDFTPSIHDNNVLRNLYYRQLEMVSKKIEGLHEDLQLDYKLELDQLS